MSTQYLTKSLFKLAMECPTKLYYAARLTEYANQSAIDPFLDALAEGGYQVGELAKHYFPDGLEIKAPSIEEQVAETQRLLQQDQVTIFEAAIARNNLFVAVDILIKDGNCFQLIEVKAKSYDESDTKIIGKQGKIIAKWKPYIEDVAYQTHVLQLAYPQANIKSCLMLVNKNAVAGTTGINQKFTIVRDSLDRKSVKVSNSLCADDLEPKLLIKVPVDDAVQLIYDGTSYPHGTFSAEVDFLSEQHRLGQKIKSKLGGHCKTCEFKCIDGEQSELKSGFKTCWQEVLGWRETDFLQPNVMEIWKLRKKNLNDWLARGLAKIAEVESEALPLKPSQENGLSNSERQWLQIKKVQSNDDSPYLDVAGLKKQMQQWVFPLHFIDFETNRPAITFIKGHHPYELVAFQFSHHRVDADGTVAHVGQYLNADPGVFPNLEFIRQLCNNLSQDQGTIFQYSPHENTTLNHIEEKLLVDTDPPPDQELLLDFIRSITKSKEKSKEQPCGNRCMVDMLELVKKYYYDPATHGSNSIKDVLPAILNSSSWLKDRYSKPIYGAAGGIASLNFKNWTWLKEVDGKINNPYDRLPKLFDELDQAKLDLMTQDDKIAHGGAALTAYRRLQFSQMSQVEREALCQGLLKYCELDTLAMVMLHEGWLDLMG